MSNLTASELSNDEMERKRFESWFSEQYKEVMPSGRYYWFALKSVIYERTRARVAWEAWQAALKSKQGEV
ncbi:hypothetical protein [Pantoea stewartii]|uniref:hypothetical protein n=1 Tax=Pantoea stewartii TaxID=66269 RepID=UPI00197DB050|nr:hypothetical protein [Pantoea stewartii]